MSGDRSLPVDVAAIQTVPEFGAVSKNVERTVDAIEACGDAELIVLPELANTGYAFDSRSEARELAEPSDGPTVAAWEAAASQVDAWIVGGYAERAGAALYNSAAVVSPDGLVGTYRKTHLWDEEHLLFESGEALPVFSTPFGRLGVQICNDLWFPEATVTQAKRGADLVALPTNWVPATADGARPGGWTIGVHAAVANANANRVAFACADRAGTERGLEFMGQSAILDPDGLVAAGPAPADGEATLTATIDLAPARQKPITDYDHVLADRRPELYDT
jgi:predicted amidohydrolase